MNKLLFVYVSVIGLGLTFGVAPDAMAQTKTGPHNNAKPTKKAPPDSDGKQIATPQSDADHIPEVITSLSSTMPPQSLNDVYAAALNRSETVNIQQDILIQARENTTQAQGAILPTISGYGDWTHQHLPVAGGILYPHDSRNSRISATQPIFEGFRDFAALRQRKYLADAQVFNLKQAARQLFYDVAQAYYNVIALQSDENDYRDEITVNRTRLDELNRFIKIGRSRVAEMLQFQSNISALEAQLENTHGQLEAAKATLAFFTGGPPETPLRDSEQLYRSSTLDESLRGVEQRPDVIAALNNAKAYHENIQIAKGGHLPSLEGVADYYFQRPNIPSAGVDWDIGLQLTVPIFEGGIIQSQVRAAVAQANQYDQALSQARRMAEQEIREYYAIYDADQKQVQKLQDTYNWSKKNYEAELRDYRNGQVTNLDVLTAITTYQDAQRGLDHMRSTLRLDSVRLQAAIGSRTETDVSPQNPYKK